MGHTPPRPIAIRNSIEQPTIIDSTFDDHVIRWKTIDRGLPLRLESRSFLYMDDGGRKVDAPPVVVCEDDSKLLLVPGVVDGDWHFRSVSDNIFRDLCGRLGVPALLLTDDGGRKIGTIESINTMRELLTATVRLDPVFALEYAQRAVDARRSRWSHSMAYPPPVAKQGRSIPLRRSRRKPKPCPRRGHTFDIATQVCTRCNMTRERLYFSMRKR